MATTAQQTTRPEERFLTAFEAHAGQTLNGTSEAVHGRRQQAIERFRALGLPTNRLEAWKYTNIARVFDDDYHIALSPEKPALSKDDLTPFLIPGLDAHLLVTVNGRFRADLSDLGALPEGAVVTGFAEASKCHADLLDRYYGQYADFQNEALTALNTAFAQDGVFVYVPKGTALEQPVFVLHLSRSGQDLFMQPRNLLVAEDGALVRIIESRAALSEARTLTNAVTEAFVGQNAYLDHYVVQDEGENASLILTTAAYQEADSLFDTHTTTLSGRVVRNNLTITPDAEHCETHLYGLYLGRGEMHVDNHTVVEHAQPDCFSNELYKGVLNERSTGVFNGRVHVHPDAQRINAYQSNKNIVLTREASIYSKPELEIYADDVQCSHGSTTGQLDEEAVFYLRTRGLSEEKARRVLLRAFARDVVEAAKIEPLRAWLDERVARRFED